MPEAFICAALRTPIGRYGGSLSSVRPDDLGAMPLKALMERYPSVDRAAVDDVIFGCANQAGEDNRNPLGMSGARLIATATHEMQERGLKRALATMCIGVGQGALVWGRALRLCWKGFDLPFGAIRGAQRSRDFWLPCDSC